MTVSAPRVVDTDPRGDGLDLLARNYAFAAAAAGVQPERFFRVGDRVVRLRFAGDALVSSLTRALAHLEIEPVEEPELTVELWDSVSTSTELSPLLAGLIELAQKAPFDVLTPRYELRPLQNDRVSATYDLGSGVMSMFDGERGQAYYWVNDAAGLPYYERGAPLRTLLNWWLSRRQLHCVHAGAVGTADGAVLLTGKGGSGKSTTSLACVHSELQYASDDYCVIGRDPEPRVYSLYNTGKLNGAEDLARQPAFEPWIVNPERMGEEKLLMFLNEHVPERMLRSAPLRAIVIPRVSGQPRSELHRIPAATALKALAPTTMFQLPGAAGNAMMLMAGLVRTVPCYRLDSGTDIQELPGLLANLLRELSENDDSSQPGTPATGASTP